MCKLLSPSYDCLIVVYIPLWIYTGISVHSLAYVVFVTIERDILYLIKLVAGRAVITSVMNVSGNHFIYKTRRNAAGARIGGITAEVKLGIPNTFDVQLGYTFQKSLYVEPEKWSEDVEAQRRMFRSPDHYGYLSSNFYITKRLYASLFGTYTGPMLVQHAAHTTIEGVEMPDSEVETPTFWDLGLKVGYTFKLTDIIKLEVNVGVKNILDSYQSDIDMGAGRDSAYIYGPALPRTYFFGVKLFL